MLEFVFGEAIWWIIGAVLLIMIIGGSGPSGIYDGQDTGTDWNEYHRKRDEEERAARENGKPEWPRGNEGPPPGW